MVHIETQKVKVLRANQKNAKQPEWCHRPFERVSGLLGVCPETLIEGLGVKGFRGFRVFRGSGLGFRG